MSTSGSTNFSMTRNEIIKDAFILLGVVGIEQTVESPDQSFAERQLNRLIKAWQSTPCKLWKRREGVFFPAAEQIKYTVGAIDHFTTFEDAVFTTISAAEASGQTILSVTSSTGMLASDNVGIELDDGTRQWTTISTVDSSTQITVATALTGAAAANNTVYSYTSKINRPLSIIDARRRQNVTDSTPTDNPITLLRYDEYQAISSKKTEGIINSFYYDKKLTSGVFYVWPEPSNVDDVIIFTYNDPIEDMDASTDNPDFPQEWLDALVYQLATRLAPSYGKYKELPSLKALADEYAKIVMDWNADEAPIKFEFEKS